MNKKASIAILDYGVGNLYSMTRAVGSFTDAWTITDDPVVLGEADKVILPGVGSFQAGMEGLHVRGLETAVKEFAASGRPVLGVCLGAQLLLDRGFEFGSCKGLGIIPGKVTAFPELSSGTKVPHIGWSQITVSQSGEILKGLPKTPYVYFVHSYVLQPTFSKHIVTTTLYGGREFCSMVQSAAVYGTQFHPEKSGSVGLKILKNFIDLKL